MDCNVAWESGNGWDPSFVAKHNNRRFRFGDSSAVALCRNAGLRRLRFRHLLLPLAACSQRRHVGRPAVLLQLRPDPLHAEDPRRAERSEEHTSELQSLMRISYAVFCLKKKNTNNKITYHT